MTLLAACSSTKSSITTKDSTTIKKATYKPKIEDVNTLNGKYSEQELAVIKQGFAIYTNECTKCHGEKNILSFNESEWANIIDDMAPKAKLNSTQKEAVSKYILAIKAMQIE